VNSTGGNVETGAITIDSSFGDQNLLDIDANGNVTVKGAISVTVLDDTEAADHAFAVVDIDAGGNVSTKGITISATDPEGNEDHIAHATLDVTSGGNVDVDGDIVIARSGTIGIDYRLFAADRIQNITHIQSILMRRRSLSSLQVHTASTSIKVPYMPTRFIRQVIDYCAFRAESTQRSWM